MGRLIALDTNCFIYFLQGMDYPDQHRQARLVFALIERGQVKGMASVLALAEVLTGPKRRGFHDLADTFYVTLKTFPNLSFVSVDEPTALLAADLRAERDLKMPDALHLAAAAAHGADAFITNDERLATIASGPEVVPLGRFAAWLEAFLD